MADGVYLFDEGQVRRRPAFDVEVTDTTGAGDAFTAGLIHAWVLEEMTMDEVIRFASAVGA